jgi:hypothetical protein
MRWLDCNGRFFLKNFITHFLKNHLTLLTSGRQQIFTTSFHSAHGTSVTDPHNLDVDLNPNPPFYFEADPDPIFHFDADPDPHQSDQVLRQLVYRPTSTQFCAFRPGLHCERPRPSLAPLSLNGSSILSLMRIRPLKMMRIRIRNTAWYRTYVILGHVLDPHHIQIMNIQVRTEIWHRFTQKNQRREVLIILVC